MDEEAKTDALIRFFYKVDPDKLSVDKWCKYSEEINFVLKYTGQLVPKVNG